jgi:hypothetical protein
LGRVGAASVGEVHGDAGVRVVVIVGDPGGEAHHVLQSGVQDPAQGRAVHHQVLGTSEAGLPTPRELLRSRVGPTALVEQQRVLAGDARGGHEQFTKSVV